MPSVTLTKPVRHDGEDLVAGDVIPDLSDRQAKRLISLGFARMGVTVVRAEPEAVTAPEDSGISPSELDEIGKMKKKDLIDHLNSLGIETDGKETVQSLRDRLIKAYSDYSDDDGEGDAGGEGGAS